MSNRPIDRPLKDDGSRIQFADGAVRSGHKGQGRFDLLPFRALQRLAVIFEKGAAKYAPDNWLKGMPLRQFADSALNHYRKAMMGMTDEDHWAMAAWNILAIVEYQERMQEGVMDKKWDDLPQMPALTPLPVLGPMGAGQFVMDMKSKQTR